MAAGVTTNQITGSTPKRAARLTESFLPPVMQALAYYIELLQYEPLYTTTIEPPFTVSTTPLTLPTHSNDPTVSATTPIAVQHLPVTLSSQPTTITQKPTTMITVSTAQEPVTQWNPPVKPSTSTTTTMQTPIWCERNFIFFLIWFL